MHATALTAPTGKGPRMPLDLILIALLLANIALAGALLVVAVGARRQGSEDAERGRAASERLEHQIDRDRALEAQRLEALETALGEVRGEMSELRGQTLQQLSGQQAALLAQLGESAKRLDAVRETLDKQLEASRTASGTQLEAIRTTVDTQLKAMQADNTAQLERMRATVDEKLQKTLNERITQSFQLVNESLDKVGRGLGEMQSLAADVGGLKKVLGNVKARGIVGEIQLGAILKEILSPAQYDEDVATVPGSANRVEFAVKMPGEGGDTVYLPIDSKFPGDAYEHLRDAQAAGDPAAVDAAWKTLEGRIKSEAKDIREKYVAPPATTSFAIMFLPFEGLYAEVADRPGLLEELQRAYRVNVAGPSTMAALLNSLQMGFQTVAIQKRASEIQNVLAAVKTEFGTYQKMLEKAQKQLGTVSKTVDSLVGTRTRAMERKLRSITELGSAAEAERVLGIEAADDEEEE